MASSINWGGVGAVQRTFDTAPAVRIDKEDLAALGNAVGDMMGRKNRAAAVDNDPQLERMKARLAELKNAKASADASAAMGGEAVTAEYDAEIADLETRIAAREAEVGTARKEYENDPEFITARREYVSNGDRSHLDSFWRNREAARLRKVQEEQLAEDKRKAEEEQAKDRATETEIARANVRSAKADLNDARKTGEKVEQAEAELAKAEAALKKLDPSYAPEYTEYKGLTSEGLNDLTNRLGVLENKKDVTDEDVAVFIAELEPYKNDVGFAETARKLEERAMKVRTPAKKKSANDAAFKAEKKKVEDFNSRSPNYRSKNAGNLGVLKFFKWDDDNDKYVGK